MSDLTVCGLRKSYPRCEALRDISFTARAGEVVGLMGPNGAGKSTTLNILAGLVREDAGEIRWASASLTRNRSRVVALVPETPEVLPLLTVWEHLCLVARAKGLPAGWPVIAADLTERFQLDSVRERLGESLSKGMKQKVMVACGVLAGTDVIIFDEPMVGLDPAAQREMRQLTRRLADDGRVVLVSSHGAHDLEQMCDTIVIMSRGSVVAAGAADELRARWPVGSLEDVFLHVTAEQR